MFLSSRDSKSTEFFHGSYQLAPKRHVISDQGLAIGGKKKKEKTYSTRDSLVVTHPTTSLAIRGLSMGERTGSRVFHYLWPYVVFTPGKGEFDPWIIGPLHILFAGD